MEGQKYNRTQLRAPDYTEAHDDSIRPPASYGISVQLAHRRLCAAVSDVPRLYNRVYKRGLKNIYAKIPWMVFPTNHLE